MGFTGVFDNFNYKKILSSDFKVLYSKSCMMQSKRLFF
jgi:hypothetical protein